MVITRCCPDTSSALALADKTTALAEIILSDPESKEKAGAGEGPRRRRTTKNMMTGG